VLKAVAAERGQLAGARLPGQPAAVMEVTLPSGYAKAEQVPDCFATSRAQPAGCARDLTYEPGFVNTTTYVGHYPALYYLLVGWPSRLIMSPDGAVYAMRLVSDVLSPVFLSLALALVLADRARGWLPLIGVAVALTPQVIFLASVVNPAGLAISAALCLWTAGLSLCRSRRRAPRTGADVEVVAIAGRDNDQRSCDEGGVSDRALLLIVVVSALVEAFSVALAPLWVAVTGVALIGAASAVSRSRLWRDRDVRLAAAVVVLGLAAAGALVVRNGSLAVMGSSRKVAAGTSFPVVLVHALSWLPAYIGQAVGAMGWLETRPPLLTYAIWGALLLGIALAALRFGSRRMRSVLVSCGAVGLLAPVLIPASRARALGSIVWEGKDGMELWVGLPLLAACAGARWWSEHPRTARAALGAVGAAQFAAFLGALHRYTVGLHGPWDMVQTVAQGWSPPLPAPVLVGLCALVLMVGWRLLDYRPTSGQRYDGVG
jgi:hypothetical protein